MSTDKATETSNSSSNDNEQHEQIRCANYATIRQQFEQPKENAYKPPNLSPTVMAIYRLIANHSLTYLNIINNI